MRTLKGVSALALFAALAAACTSGGASPSAAAPSAATSPEPTAASAAPSDAASPSASAEACTPDQLQTKTAGTLTFGADNPAFPPYFEASSPNPSPWELGDPTNGQGFEGAVAAAVAEELGYSQDQVTWVVTPFNNAIQPGPKDFDLYITQVSYTPERAQGLDLSEGYYDVAQSVVALEGSQLANAKTIADLAGYTYGAQVGTTSLRTIQDVIKPTAEPQVFDSNDAAVEALKNGQIDGLVVDLPTAFFVTAVQVENGVIVGQFPPTAEGEYFSFVLDKDSPLTPCVNQAIASLKESGELDRITQEWLADKANAPVFQP